MLIYIFLFKQKTAYEMRISDWSPDVCSSDLGKNGRSWETLGGYTVADLMAHLERQFLPGMSWDNRGQLHIDHIRPLCSFEFTSPDDPQFREAWALTNLRPLWARDNLRKGGRLDLLL